MSFRCWTCHGNGRIKCSACQAKGQLKCYIKLTVSFKNNKIDHIVERTALPDHLIRGARGKVVFQDTQPRGGGSRICSQWSTWGSDDFPIVLPPYVSARSIALSTAPPNTSLSHCCRTLPGSPEELGVRV